ncbi:hypothetical protein CEXT_689011 [Caerostris extrusa]|uniref:Uncharacterized protein n=1 Tax=Caerostris extrusa TaxID=172846 RepID=A0AAV4PK51_CAEEX|nr:hypothetical protein CEXT_689011 [Caerostris extrusa]
MHPCDRTAYPGHSGTPVLIRVGGLSRLSVVYMVRDPDSELRIPGFLAPEAANKLTINHSKANDHSFLQYAHLSFQIAIELPAVFILFKAFIFKVHHLSYSVDLCDGVFSVTLRSQKCVFDLAERHLLNRHAGLGGDTAGCSPGLSLLRSHTDNELLV